MSAAGGRLQPRREERRSRRSVGRCVSRQESPRRLTATAAALCSLSRGGVEGAPGRGTFYGGGAWGSDEQRRAAIGEAPRRRPDLKAICHGSCGCAHAAARPRLPHGELRLLRAVAASLDLHHLLQVWCLPRGSANKGAASCQQRQSCCSRVVIGDRVLLQHLPDPDWPALL